MRISTGWVLACAVAAMGATASGAEGERPIGEQAYADLILRDHPASGGSLVGWVLPGPLKGTAFASPYLNRGE